MDRQLGESREEVKYREDRTAAKCVEYFVDARDCDLRDLGDLVQFLVFDCDMDAARLLWYTYQGTRPRGSGMLDETGCNVGVENGVDLFRKDWVQSVRAGSPMMALCAGGFPHSRPRKVPEGLGERSPASGSDS